MERSQGGARRIMVYDEVYQYPLGLSVVCLLFMIFVLEAKPARRFGRSGLGQSTLLLAFIFSAAVALQSHDAFASAKSFKEYQGTKKGLKAYDDKDYAEATREFSEAQAENPDSVAHHLNLGDALLKSGSPEAAIKEFEQVAKSKSASVNDAARGAYNLGRSYELQGDNEKALEALQGGLERLASDPKNADPEIVMRIKRALERNEQQKQQQKQNKDKQQKQQDKQDQNKQEKKNDQDQKSDGKKEDEKDQKKVNPKRQFKGEKLTEDDAKRILQQLSEQEKKSQQRMMRNKTGKPKSEKNQKDW
jgi:hypothetical protein